MGTECTLWQGAIDRDGYGKLEHRMAHRVVLERHLGRLLRTDEEVDHRCHTEDARCPGGRDCRHRRCVNVDHLEIVTHLENVARGVRARRTHCVNGHAYTESNTYRRASGARDCRLCIAKRARDYQARRKAA